LDKVETWPVTFPVTLPSRLATNVPNVAKVMLPVADPSAVVRPRVNLSADSSQINTALSEDPLLINIPESLTGDPVRLEFNSNKLSSIFKLVVSK